MQPEHNNGTSNVPPLEAKDEAAGVDVRDDSDVDSLGVEYRTTDEKSPLGTKKIEAITSTWSQLQLILAFISIFFLAAMYALQSIVTSLVALTATSSFEAHSLLAALNTTASIVSAVIVLPLAKILDVWGRTETLVLVGLFNTIGNVVLAATTNINEYFGGTVLRTIGASGISYVNTVLISDISQLRSRVIYLALANTPFIVTPWIGAPIADGLTDHSTWRWGFGMFAILVPTFVASTTAILGWNQHRAAQNPELRPTANKELTSEVPWRQRVWSWIEEVDLIGLTFLAAGFSLLLLAVTLASYNGSTWQSTHIIVMLVIGPILLIIFVLWEKFGARRPIVPVEFMIDRTILGSALLGAFLDAAFYMWDAYFTSFLQVVTGLSLTDAGYVGNIYDVVSDLWGPILGLLIARYDRYKIFAILGVPIYVLGAGLMIRFRYEGSSVVALCWCQILIAWGGGTLVLTGQIAAMAVTSHDKIARVLAFRLLFTFMGAAIGSAISGAVWTNTLLEKITEYLPANEKDQAQTIYDSLTVQLSYPMGSPTRNAIIHAYEDTQLIMTIAATCISAFMIVFVLMLRNERLSDKIQVRGQVL